LVEIDSIKEIRYPCNASVGNFLEALNTALNLLGKHYMDRDLSRTGNSIVVISPGIATLHDLSNHILNDNILFCFVGCGFYHVTPDLSLITKQRMMDGGIGIDFISLRHPPLHHVPLFHVHSVHDGISDFYDFPYWINVCYVDCKRDSSATVNRSDKSTKDNKKSYMINQRSHEDIFLNGNNIDMDDFGQRLYPQHFGNTIDIPLIRLNQYNDEFSSNEMKPSFPIHQWGKLNVQEHIQKLKQLETENGLFEKSSSNRENKSNGNTYYSMPFSSPTDRNSMLHPNSLYTEVKSINISHDAHDNQSEGPPASVASSHGSDLLNDSMNDVFHLTHLSRRNPNNDDYLVENGTDLFSSLGESYFLDYSQLLQAMENYDENVFGPKSNINRRFVAPFDKSKMTNTLLEEGDKSMTYMFPQTLYYHSSDDLTKQIQNCVIVRNQLEVFIEEDIEVSKLEITYNLNKDLSLLVVNIYLPLYQIKYTAAYSQTQISKYSEGEFLLLRWKKLQLIAADPVKENLYELSNVIYEEESNTGSSKGSNNLKRGVEIIHNNSPDRSISGNQNESWNSKYSKDDMLDMTISPSTSSASKSNFNYLNKMRDDNTRVSKSYEKPFDKRGMFFPPVKSPSSGMVAASSLGSSSQYARNSLSKSWKEKTKFSLENLALNKISIVKSHQKLKSESSVDGSINPFTYSNLHTYSPITVLQDGEPRSISKKIVEEYRERRIQVNPFRKEDGRDYLRMRTHNRLRWSHIFPHGNKNFCFTSFIV
jgi:hypothetical protein